MTPLASVADASSTTRVELKDRIRTVLDERKLGVGTVERMAGIGRGVLQRLVTGERTFPRPETLDSVAKILGVSYQWLATGEGPKEPVVEPIDDPYPGRADLRRTQYWRTLPPDLQAAVVGAVVADPEMSLEGWVALVQAYRTLRVAPQPPATLETTRVQRRARS